MIQQALGGHAIPIDQATHRVLKRLGFTESSIPALRAVLERAVPKNRGAEFLDLIEDSRQRRMPGRRPGLPALRTAQDLCIRTIAQARGERVDARATSARATKGAGRSIPAVKGAASRTPHPPKKSATAKPPTGAPHDSKSPRGKHRGEVSTAVAESSRICAAMWRTRRQPVRRQVRADAI